APPLPQSHQRRGGSHAHRYRRGSTPRIHALHHGCFRRRGAQPLRVPHSRDRLPTGSHARHRRVELPLPSHHASAQSQRGLQPVASNQAPGLSVLNQRLGRSVAPETQLIISTVFTLRQTLVCVNSVPPRTKRRTKDWRLRKLNQRRRLLKFALSSPRWIAYTMVIRWPISTAPAAHRSRARLLTQ